jgi:hypothetical protein
MKPPASDDLPKGANSPASTPRPPRAFTQGVGTVFQFVGVIFFLCSMFVCCGSALLSKNIVTRGELTAVGWTVQLPGGQRVFYSGQQAITVSVALSVFFGIALAGIGLGLQTQGRRAPYAAVVLTFAAAVFWGIQAVFALERLHSVLLSVLGFLLFGLFAVLCGFAVAALREMRRDPPPTGHEVLPADYKVPYSHMHPDPPEVRLARELEQRRDRLAVQQKELEMLEARLKRKLDERDA